MPAHSPYSTINSSALDTSTVKGVRDHVAGTASPRIQISITSQGMFAKSFREPVDTAPRRTLSLFAEARICSGNISGTVYIEHADLGDILDCVGGHDGLCGTLGGHAVIAQPQVNLRMRRIEFSAASWPAS